MQATAKVKQMVRQNCILVLVARNQTAEPIPPSRTDEPTPLSRRTEPASRARTIDPVELCI